MAIFSGNTFKVVILLLIPNLLYAAQTSNMRNKRYCEIILKKSITSYAVYNTWGLNDCPESLWNKVSVDEVKKETDASFVHLNGPRYWVIDGFDKTTLINPAVKTINGIPMREAGVLHLGIMDMLSANKPYKQHEVDRQTTWIYDAGKPVFELIDPNGNVFVMQSYSIQATAQNIDSLSQLGSKLTLPQGWQFKAGIINKAQTIKAVNNRAIVIQDDYLNTYQKASEDFLK